MKRPRRPRVPRRPIWSIKTITIVGVIVVALICALTYFLGRRSLFVETEISLAIIAAALFVFLLYGLYHGVRVRRRDVPKMEFQTIGTDRFNEFDLNTMPDVDCPMDVGADETGCLGALLAIVLWVVVLIVLLVGVWLIANLGLWLWIILVPAITWIFYRALRLVFVRGRTCKDNLPRSAGYALAYTALYTGWLFGLVYLAHRFVAPQT